MKLKLGIVAAVSALLSGCALSIVNPATSPTLIGPPTNPQVGRWATSLTQSPVLRWEAPKSPGSSELDHYEIALGSSVGTSNILPWTSVGTSLFVQVPNLKFVAGSSYVMNIRSVDKTGAISTTVSSSPWNVLPSLASAFSANTDYVGNANPRYAELVDLNADGRLDIVAGYSAASVYLNNGDGTFQPKVDYATAGNNQEAVVADFNHDGIKDIAVATYNGAPTVFSVYFGNGAGGFSVPRSDYSATGTITSLAAGDFNGDGFIDIIATDYINNFVEVFLNRGDGTFLTGVSYATGMSPKKVIVGDFNHDGFEDLAVTNLAGNSVSILTGRGDGTFQPKVDYAVDAGPYGIAAADFNHDGILDLAVGNYTANTISVLYGNRDGTFQPANLVAIAGNPYSLYAADLNGDGQVDLLTANYSTSSVGILLGNADGSFQPMQTLNSGLNPFRLAIGDLNGDGIPDIVSANRGTNTLSVFLGQ